MSVHADQGTPAWQTYLDLAADVKPYLQIDATNTTSDVQLRGIVDMACDWVQDYLGRPMAPTTFYRRFSGWSGLNGAFISLPYYPVLQVVSLIETWGLNGGHTLVYQTPESQGASGQQMYQIDWVTGIIVRTFQGLIQRPFFPGTGNVECTWQAGYNPLPPKVRIATLEMVAYWWRNTQEAPRWFGAASTEYDAPKGNGGLWPAVPNRIVSLLEPYIQVGIG